MTTGSCVIDFHIKTDTTRVAGDGRSRCVDDVDLHGVGVCCEAVIHDSTCLSRRLSHRPGQPWSPEHIYKDAVVAGHSLTSGYHVYADAFRRSRHESPLFLVRERSFDSSHHESKPRRNTGAGAKCKAIALARAHSRSGLGPGKARPRFCGTWCSTQSSCSTTMK